MPRAVKLGSRRSRTGSESKPAGTGLLKPGDMAFSSTIRMRTSTSLTGSPGSTEATSVSFPTSPSAARRACTCNAREPSPVPSPRSTGTAGAALFRWGVTGRDAQEVTVGVPQNPVADATCPRKRPTTCVSDVLTPRSFNKWWTRPAKRPLRLASTSTSKEPSLCFFPDLDLDTALTDVSIQVRDLDLLTTVRWIWTVCDRRALCPCARPLC